MEELAPGSMFGANDPPRKLPHRPKNLMSDAAVPWAASVARPDADRVRTTLFCNLLVVRDQQRAVSAEALTRLTREIQAEQGREHRTECRNFFYGRKRTGGREVWVPCFPGFFLFKILCFPFETAGVWLPN